MRKQNHLIGMVLIALASVACNAATSSESERIATEVARAKAVAATLTMAAPTAAATQVVARVVPTDAPPPTPTTAPTTELLTATAVPPTREPTRVVPKPPTPTHTPVAEAADPFVPGVGTPKGLNGKIVLPGYAGRLDPPVFKDSVVFKLVVFDPAIGNVDGAGIQAVNIQAVDPLGRTVINQREGSWAYCAFANPQNDPSCTVWRFSEHDFKWPNGTPACAGPGYNVNMVVDADDPQKTGANWNFGFDIESPDGSLPQC
jgi:hypothetical protein